MTTSSRAPVRLGRRLVLAEGMGAMLAVGGCVPELPGQGPAPRTFRLTPKNTFPEDLPKVDWTLAVAEPSAEPTLDTNRIAVVSGGTVVDYVALAFWIDRAPAMVQSLIVLSFKSSGRLAQVGTDRERLRPQFLLRSELVAFQFNRTDGAQMVRVRLDASLYRMPRRDLVGQQRFAVETAPVGSGVDAVVAAFDVALGRVLKELVGWTVRTGETAGAQKVTAA
jgi:cholesterol transport system auxiliary component